MIDPEDWYRGDPAEIVEADPESVKAELRRRVSLLGPDWHERAACRGTDLALFFPVRGQNGRKALEICGRCSVRQACLDEAMSDPDLDVGVRGGMTGRARQARRRLMVKRGRPPRGVQRPSIPGGRDDRGGKQ